MAKKKTGRKPITKNERTKVIGFSLTQEQIDRFDSMAKAYKLNRSAFLRRLLDQLFTH